MSKTRATAEFVRTGQARPYADTVTEAIITVEMSSPYVEDGAFRAISVGEVHAKNIARGLIGWSDNTDDPFATFLESFEVLGQGRYKVVTRARYND